MNFTGFAWADLLFGVVLPHQAFGLVYGFDLLLQGDVGLRCLLGTSHASRMAIPCYLAIRNIQRVKTMPGGGLNRDNIVINCVGGQTGHDVKTAEN